MPLVMTHPFTSSGTVMYTKYDALRLQRVVGTTRSHRMLLSDIEVHLFA